MEKLTQNQKIAVTTSLSDERLAEMIRVSGENLDIATERGIDDWLRSWRDLTAALRELQQHRAAARAVSTRDATDG